MAGSQPMSLEACSFCQMPSEAEELLQCSRCRAVRYCSVDCQRADWKKVGAPHKDVCRALTCRAQGDVIDVSREASMVQGLLASHEDEPRDLAKADCIASRGVPARKWKAAGVPTYYPDANMKIPDTMPMGRQADVFDGDPNVDRSFASPATMWGDRVEMGVWLSNRLAGFDQAIGNELKEIVSEDLISEQRAFEHAPLRGRTKSGRRASNNLKIVYIAGVEGTGHHGVMPMLLYAAACEYGFGGMLAWWRSLREVLQKTAPEDRRGKLRTLMAAACIDDRPRIIFEWESYPFGEMQRGRWAGGCLDPNALKREEISGNPGNSVDLAEFVDLFREYGDVRILVLHRGLVPAAWSHKEWDADLVEHARVLALFNEYLTKVLNDLTPNMWRWVAYEHICEAHFRGEFREAAAQLADFLGLQVPDNLEKAFKPFRPSMKDAAREMSPASLSAIQELELQRSRKWFPSLFPELQLLAEFVPQSKRPGPRGLPAPPQQQVLDACAAGEVERLLESLNEEQAEAWDEMCESSNETELEIAMARLRALLLPDQRVLFEQLRAGEESQPADYELDPTKNQKLRRLLDSFGAKQCKAWEEMCHADLDDQAQALARLQELLSNEQRFLLQKAFEAEEQRFRESEFASTDKLDLNMHTCMHFWIEGRGFGSELNNLVSAAMTCEAHGLACVIEDENWNSGHLHDYLNAEPLILRQCPRCYTNSDESCRPLEVRRDKQIATPGWFAVRRHADAVPFATKAEFTRRVWRYVEGTDWAIEKLNRILDLPLFYLAVHIRRGDKVIETPEVEPTAFARAALAHFQWPCTAMAVCSDDVSAAEAFAAEIWRERPELPVLWRTRAAAPKSLQNGHWQEEWNSQPLSTRVALTHEFLADIEVMRSAHVLLCTHSSNVGRLVALLRDGPTISLDEEWTNT